MKRVTAAEMAEAFARYERAVAMPLGLTKEQAKEWMEERREDVGRQQIARSNTIADMLPKKD